MPLHLLVHSDLNHLHQVQNEPVRDLALVLLNRHDGLVRHDDRLDVLDTEDDGILADEDLPDRLVVGKIGVQQSHVADRYVEIETLS